MTSLTLTVVGSATGGAILLAIVTISLAVIISAAVCYYVQVKRKTFSMSTNAAYSRRYVAQNKEVPRYTETAPSPLQAAATTEGGNLEGNENLPTRITAHDGLEFELATNIAYRPRQDSFGYQEDEYDYINTYEPII